VGRAFAIAGRDASMGLPSGNLFPPLAGSMMAEGVPARRDRRQRSAPRRSSCAREWGNGWDRARRSGPG
jgi:hypothetical protein